MAHNNGQNEQVTIPDIIGNWEELDPEESTFHYFASTAFNWAADDELRGTLDKLASITGDEPVRISLFRVPGPSTATYDIAGFCPMVKGARLIAIL